MSTLLEIASVTPTMHYLSIVSFASAEPVNSIMGPFLLIARERGTRKRQAGLM